MNKQTLPIKKELEPIVSETVLSESSHPVEIKINKISIENQKKESNKVILILVLHKILISRFVKINTDLL